MGLLSKAMDCSAFPGFAGNCVHGSQACFWQCGSMQGEWKLKSGLSSDNCHLGRKSTLGKKEGPWGHPPRRVPPGWKDTVKVTREAHSQTAGLQEGYCSHTHIFTCKQLDSPSQFYSLCFYFFSYSVSQLIKKNVSKLSTYATNFKFPVSEIYSKS